MFFLYKYLLQSWHNAGKYYLLAKNIPLING